MIGQQNPYQLCRRISHGIYVVGVGNEDISRNAFTAAWVMQVSFQPLLLALSINPQHRSYALLKQTGAFSVNILAQEQAELARHFGNPGMHDKLAGITWLPGMLGCPILPESVAWLECRLHHELPVGDHQLLVGEVVNGKLEHADRTPLLYADTANMDGAEQFFPRLFPA